MKVYLAAMIVVRRPRPNTSCLRLQQNQLEAPSIPWQCRGQVISLVSGFSDCGVSVYPNYPTISPTEQEKFQVHTSAKFFSSPLLTPKILASLCRLPCPLPPPSASSSLEPTNSPPSVPHSSSANSASRSSGGISKPSRELRPSKALPAQSRTSYSDYGRVKSDLRRCTFG